MKQNYLKTLHSHSSLDLNSTGKNIWCGELEVVPHFLLLTFNAVNF